jgi:hypothetical protein
VGELTFAKRLLKHFLCHEIPGSNPGKPIFLSESGNENYYTNAVLLLVRPSCVVIFVARFWKKNRFPRMRSGNRVDGNWNSLGSQGPVPFIPRSAPAALTGYSQVDITGAWYKSVNFGVKTSQIDEKKSDWDSGPAGGQCCGGANIRILQPFQRRRVSNSSVGSGLSEQLFPINCIHSHPGTHLI